jgi:DNA (cytosine-5)-methyltransferase 1
MPKVRVQMVKKPTVISTFAGCGGSSLGYHLAGFNELLAVEWDQNAVDTFRLNFPGVPVYHGDIAKLTGAECMRLAGIKPGELDVFDGSPPCQGFSTAGKRKFDDPRNSLFKEFARLIQELQPKVFVMENVTGMVKGVMKQAYLQIIKTLRECGYRCKGEVLNAMYYNVPQSRERVIVIGVRNDLGIEPSHPKPQTRPCGPSIDKEYSDSLILSESKFEKIDSHRRRQAAKGNGFSWQEVSSRKPSNAIVKNMMIGGANTRLVRCRQGWRYLADGEIKCIGSFPESFQFSDRESMIERIGNSVPPNLMRAIAEHIRDNILLPKGDV